MHRPRFVWAVVAATICVTTRATAQPPADGWVVLPVDEYRSLRERALPPPPPPPAPPVDATLTRVDYDLRIDGDAVAGRALLTIDVLKRRLDARADSAGLHGARRAARRSAGLARRRTAAARAADTRRPIRADARHRAAAGRVGRHRIDRAARVAVADRRARRSRCRKAASTCRSPADSSPSAPRTASESRWTAYRPAESGDDAVVEAKGRRSPRRAAAPRSRARDASWSDWARTCAQISAAVRVEVLQGLAREVVLALPAGLVVNQVNGATVGDWEIERRTAARRGCSSRSATEVSFVVSGRDARAARRRDCVPLVRMPSAERETGGVAVDVVGAGEIGGRQARGLEPADPSELGDIVAGRESPSMVAFRHRPLAGSEPRALAVAVVRYTPQAVLVANVEEARYRALAPRTAGCSCEARYAVRNNQRSFLKVTLPRGSAVWSAAGRRAADPARASPSTMPCCCRSRRGAPARRRRPSSSSSSTCSAIDGVDRPRARAARVCRRSICRSRAPASSCTTRRASASSRSRARFARTADPGIVRGGAASNRRRLLAGAIAPTPAGRGAPRGLQALVDRYREGAGGRTVVGSLPVHVTFPAFGPSIFLASELTAEGRGAVVDLTLQASEGIDDARMTASIRPSIARARSSRWRTSRRRSSRRAAGDPTRDGHAVAHRIQPAARSRQPPAAGSDDRAGRRGAGERRSARPRRARYRARRVHV